MDAETFDRLTCLFIRSGTRRAALSALLGSALLGTALGSAAAKPQPDGQGKPNSTGKRRGKHKRRGKRQGGVSAQAKTKPGNHCISPFGTDLNEFYGISAVIVTGYCAPVNAGERWMTSGVWFVNDTFEIVPEGFVPAGATPVQDFQAKFTALKFVIDPNTRQEQTVVFTNTDDLSTDNASEYVGFPTEFHYVSAITLGTVHPLSVGDHVVDVYWVFNAMHCDGRGDDTGPTRNCFPAGETKYVPGLAFEVVPGHH